MNSQFLVSVITPAYNAGKYIRKAVEAAVNQDEVGEVLIIEDCSPDNTFEICQQLAIEYDKVRLLQHPDKKNHGCGASRNLGIANAKFEYISFADADNFYLPNRFKIDKELFKENPEIEGVYHAEGNYYYSEKAKQIFHDAGFANQEFLRLTDRVSSEDLPYVLISAHPNVTGEFGTDAITIKKSAIEKVGPFNTALRLQQDIDLWLRLAAKCKLVPGDIVNPVALRGVHESQRMVNVQAQAKYGLMRMESLLIWFKKEIKDYRLYKTFEMQYIYSIVTTKKNFKAKLLFLKYILLNPYHIKYQYNFFDIVFFELFGRSYITLKFISIKNKILKARHIVDYRSIYPKK